MSTRIRVAIGHDCSLLALLETYGLPLFTPQVEESMITVGRDVSDRWPGRAMESCWHKGSFSETIALLAKITFIPKGVYRFRSHMEANTQQADCLAKGMGRLAAERV